MKRCIYRCRALFAVIAALFVIQSLFAYRADSSATPLLVIEGFTVAYLEGVLLAVMLALRLLVIVLCAQILLCGQTRDYLLALAQMRVPYEICFMTAVGLHFLPILREEAIGIYQAMQLRGVNFRKTALPRRIKSYASLCLPVFVGTLRRADETATAMELRAFRAYPKRTYMRRLRLRCADVVMMLLWTAGVFALFVWFGI